MRAEIIAIGDELANGERLDTNSQWLSQRLSDLGIRALFHTTVGDDLAANVQVFRVAAERADLVIATGGLGPTADDLTREAVASAFDAPLQRDLEVLEQIRALFRRRGREMPERNSVQADFPTGSQVVPNPHGSAPGFWLTRTRSNRSSADIIALPGVPAEMKQMWHETIEAELLRRQGDQRTIIRHKTLHCFGAGESDIEAMLPDLIRRGRSPVVGITASRATITLRISAQGANEQECEALMAPTAQTIRNSLGSLVFGEDGQTLEQVVIQTLRQRGESVAVFDAVSGGRILQWLRDCDDSGDCFVGGTLLSSAAVRALALAQERSALEPETPSGRVGDALRLAAECRDRFATTWGLALRLTRSGSTADFPAGQELVEIGLTNGAVQMIETQRFAAHPDIQLPRAAKQGLDLLRRTLRES